MSENQYKKPLLDLLPPSFGHQESYKKPYNKGYNKNGHTNYKNNNYYSSKNYYKNTEKENHSPDSGYDFNENPLTFDLPKERRPSRHRDQSGASNSSRNSQRSRKTSSNRSRKNSKNNRRHSFAEPTVPQPYRYEKIEKLEKIDKIEKPEQVIPEHSNSGLEELTEGLEKMDLSCQTPLNDPWTLYIDHITTDTQQTVEDYTSNLTKIYKITTIENFWQVFNNIPAPSFLPPNYSFHLMRGDRRPVWEDPANADAGYWKMKCVKSKGNLVWQELVLAAIGEQFTEMGSNKSVGNETDQVVGISISIRERDDHFMVWNSNYKCTEASNVVDDIKNILLPKLKFHSIFYKDINEHADFDCNKYNGKIFFLDQIVKIIELRIMKSDVVKVSESPVIPIMEVIQGNSP